MTPKNERPDPPVAAGAMIGAVICLLGRRSDDALCDLLVGAMYGACAGYFVPYSLPVCAALGVRLLRD